MINIYQLEKYYHITQGLRKCNPELLEENPEMLQKVLIIEALTKDLWDEVKELADDEDE